VKKTYRARHDKDHGLGGPIRPHGDKKPRIFFCRDVVQKGRPSPALRKLRKALAISRYLRRVPAAEDGDEGEKLFQRTSWAAGIFRISVLLARTGFVGSYSYLSVDCDWKAMLERVAFAGFAVSSMQLQQSQSLSSKFTAERVAD